MATEFVQSGYIEVWRDGEMVSRHRVEREAVESALAHSDRRGDGEYELRFPSVKIIVRRPIVEPDGPALGQPVALSDTQIRVPLDRPATGPTTIDFYTLERSIAGLSSFSQIAQGLGIFPFDDSGLVASTEYDYRANATDTTERTSAWGYASGSTSPPTIIDAPDHTIAAGATAATFNGSSVAPGEIVEFAAGIHGPRVINNLTGTALNPIVIRNSPDGQVVIRNSSTARANFVLDLDSCSHFILDGGYSSEPYGIVVTTTRSSDSVTAFIKVRGTSSNYTIRNVEVDGEWPTYSINGIGISTQDGTEVLSSASLGAATPSNWRENIVIEDCYVHDVEGEGMYLGPNWDSLEWPVRNITIRNNQVENTGWDGIQGKSWVAGTNSIYGNTVIRAGIRTDGTASQHHGISINPGKGNIYANYIEEAGESGIQIYSFEGPPTTYGAMTCTVENNVVVRSGQLGLSSEEGITVGAGGTPVHSTIAPPVPTIRHNTVVSSGGNGIDCNSAVLSGVVRDNIVAGSGGTAVTTGSGVTQTTNLTGTVVSIGFIDYANDDYGLTISSAATGTATGPSPDTDYAGTTRGTPADRGAIEYVP